jgi:hypothetical protein
MGYHNVRGKDGRFASKKKTRITRKKAVVSTPVTILSAFLLDYSVSMRGKESATVEGFNSIITNAEKDTNATGVTSVEFLGKFGDPANFRWEQGTVKPFSKVSDYQPKDGSTALHDAVGNAIHNLEYQLIGRPANTKILLTIFTDGEENSSKVWNSQSIKARIQEKQSAGWVITFIGAGSEKQVKATADAIGIFASNTLAYDNTAKGTKVSMDLFTKSRSAYTNKVAVGTDSNVGFFSND